MAPVGIAVALGIEVAHDVGQGVEHGGTVREQRRAPRCCKRCQQLINSAQCAKPCLRPFRHSKAASHRTRATTAPPRQNLFCSDMGGLPWHVCHALCCAETGCCKHARALASCPSPEMVHWAPHWECPAIMGVQAAAYSTAAKSDRATGRGVRTGGAVQVGGYGDLVDPGPVQQRLKEGVGVAQLVCLNQVDVCGKASAPAQSNDAERCSMAAECCMTCKLTWQYSYSDISVRGSYTSKTMSSTGALSAVSAL